MSSRPLSPEELENLARLDAMDDEDIDLSDAPELTEEQWNDPRRPRYVLEREQPVDLPIDGRVVHWLRDHAEGRSVELEVNRVLLDYVREQQRRAG